MSVSTAWGGAATEGEDKLWLFATVYPRTEREKSGEGMWGMEMVRLGKAGEKKRLIFCSFNSYSWQVINVFCEGDSS